MDKLQQSILSSIIFITASAGPGCSDTYVIYPEKKEIIETVYASGKIFPENEYKLSALINGIIAEKLVHDGDTVARGQILFVIRNESARERYAAALNNYNIAKSNSSVESPLLNDFKLSLNNAEVKFQNDSVNYHRWKNLWDKNIGTKINLDNAWISYQFSRNQKKIAEYKYQSALNEISASLSKASSELTAARNDLKDYYVRSELDGVVYQTFKEAGEAVHANDLVALLGKYQQPVIRLAVDQQDIDKICIGQQVLLQSDVTGGQIYQAIVTNIFPVMNEVDQTFRVDARFSALPDQLFMHSSIEANIIVQKKSNALVVPHNAITGSDSIWVRLSGKQKKLQVRTGISTLEYVEILSGIDERTPVLINPK